MQAPFLLRPAGSHWSILDPAGAVVAYAPTFDRAWRALNSLSGERWPSPEQVPRRVEARREPDALVIARALAELAEELV